MTEQASSGTQAAESTAPQQPEAAESQATPQYPKTVKVKDEGRELEIPFEQVVNEWQAQAVSTRRFQEAAQMKRQMEELMGGLSKKDLNSFQKLTKVVGEENLRPLVEQWLFDKISYDKMSPEQKEYLKTKQERDEYAQRLKENEEKQQSQIRDQLKQKAFEEIDTEINEHLKLSKYKTPRLVARAVETILANLNSNGAKIPLKDAWARAEEDMNQDVQSYVKDLDIEDLRKILSKEQLKALRQADVEAARSSFHSQNRATPKQEGSETPRKKKHEDFNDWFEGIGNRFVRK